MKNKEKYRDEIFEIACAGESIAIDKYTNKPAVCAHTECEDCIAGTEKDRCEKDIKEWCEAEYIEKPKLTSNERKILEIIDPKFKYIARDFNRYLAVYIEKPQKDIFDECWCTSDDIYEKISIKLFRDVNFDMVQWENEDPWLIEDLKRLEVKESTND